MTRYIIGEGVNNADASEVLARDAVKFIGELLQNLEARQNNRDHDCYERQKNYDRDGSSGTPLPTLAHNLRNRNRDGERRANKHLCAHTEYHLELGDIVGGAGDKAARRELARLVIVQLLNLVEELLADNEREAGGNR